MPTQNADGTYDDTGPDLGGLLGAVLGKEVSSDTTSNQTTQGSTAQTTSNAAATTNQQATTGATTSQQATTGQTTTGGTTSNVGTQATTGTIGRTNDTTQQTQQSTQQTGDVAGLHEVLNRQLAGITPEQLASIFEQGSRAAPQLIVNQANALGARVGDNSPLSASLRELQTNLVAKAADINAKMLSDAGGTAAQIAQATKSIQSSGSNISSSIGQDVQDLLTSTTGQQTSEQTQNTINNTTGATTTNQNVQGASTTQGTTQTAGTQTQGVSATENKDTSTTINTNVAKTLVGAFVGGVALDQIFRSATGKGFTGTLVDLAKQLVGQGAKLNDINSQLTAAGFPPITQQEALDYLINNPPGNTDLPPYEYPMPEAPPDVPIPEIPDPEFIDYGEFFADGGMPGRKKRVGYADGGVPSAQFLPIEPLIKRKQEVTQDDSSVNMADIGPLLTMLSGGAGAGGSGGGGGGGGNGSVSPAISGAPGEGTSPGPGSPVGAGGIATPGSVPVGAVSMALGTMGRLLSISNPALAALISLMAPAIAGGIGNSTSGGAPAPAPQGSVSVSSGEPISDAEGNTIGITGGDPSADGSGPSSSSADGGTGSADGSAYADGGYIREPKVGTRSPLPVGEGGGGLSRSAVQQSYVLPPPLPASAPMRFEKGTIPRVEKGLRDAGAYADGGMITNINGDDWSIATEATGGADEEYHLQIMSALGITRTPGGLQFDKNARNMLAATLGPNKRKQPTGYGNGGEIKGPGTGTSDSIPAVAEGRPIRVGNGEYIVPEDVVNRFGADAFDALVQQFHTPVRT